MLLWAGLVLTPGSISPVPPLGLSADKGGRGRGKAGGAGRGSSMQLPTGLCLVGAGRGEVGWNKAPSPHAPPQLPQLGYGGEAEMDL